MILLMQVHQNMLQNVCYFRKEGCKEMVIIQKSLDRIFILRSHLVKKYHLFNIFFPQTFLLSGPQLF